MARGLILKRLSPEAHDRAVREECARRLKKMFGITFEVPKTPAVDAPHARPVLTRQQKERRDQKRELREYALATHDKARQLLAAVRGAVRKLDDFVTQEKSRNHPTVTALASRLDRLDPSILAELEPLPTIIAMTEVEDAAFCFDLTNTAFYLEALKSPGKWAHALAPSTRSEDEARRLRKIRFEKKVKRIALETLFYSTNRISGVRTSNTGNVIRMTVKGTIKHHTARVRSELAQIERQKKSKATLNR